MIDNVQTLFRPVATQARERMMNLEHHLDAVAKETTARFARGNAAIQMGLLEVPDDLAAQREVLIKRRA